MRSTPVVQSEDPDARAVFVIFRPARLGRVTPSSLGIESLAQLLDLAKRKPGMLMYASAGIGTPPHMSVGQLKAATKMSIDHVPFKGSPGVVQALMGAEVAVGMEAVTALMPLIETGKVRALAVTGNLRMEILPDVPTFSELGVPEIGMLHYRAFTPAPQQLP